MTRHSKAKRALMLLNNKSQKAQVVFRQMAHENNTGIENIDKALDRYLSRWKDTTRPGLLAIAHEAVGGRLEDIVPLQVALSFIDVTMDIHDDIIDESATKKNVKTIYGALGRETALLIGDEYMTKSFYYLHQSIAFLPKDRQILIMNVTNSFLAEVVRAHISEVQLKKIKWRVKPETYLQVLIKKAADIEGRMKIGSIYGGGSEEEIDALSIYGRNLGVLLAVRAEFGDLFEPDELSCRIRDGCLPIQVLYALQKRKYSEKIHSLLSKEEIDASDSRKLLLIIQETKTLPLLRERLEHLKNEAIQALTKLQSKREKDSLELVVTSMLEDL